MQTNQFVGLPTAGLKKIKEGDYFADINLTLDAS